MVVVNSIGELRKVIRQRIEEQGLNCNLNDIDVSRVDDMSSLFTWSKFSGDLSEWDVSQVKDMYGMFAYSQFFGDISNWDIGNVRDMTGMFFKSPLEDEAPKWYKQPNLYVRAG